MWSMLLLSHSSSQCLAFCSIVFLFMRHIQNHRANLPFKCEFLFIICSVIPFFLSTSSSSAVVVVAASFFNIVIQMRNGLDELEAISFRCGDIERAREEGEANF